MTYYTDLERLSRKLWRRVKYMFLAFWKLAIYQGCPQ
jgi:hypothetical protein